MPTATLDAREMEAQISLGRPVIRDAFLRAVSMISDASTLREVEALIESGRALEALDIARRAAQAIGDSANRAYVGSAERISRWAARNAGAVVDFDRVNQRAVDQMRSQRLRIVTEFTREQYAATRQSLSEAVRQGLNPRQAARSFRDSIGLTSYQEQIVRNYRRQLEQGEPGALDRRLRDRRADRGVARAIDRGRPLPQERIDSLVERYRQNWISHRAETIARTEALGAAHAGSAEALRQAVADGDLAGAEIVRRWIHRPSADEREFHVSMHGQERGVDEAFVSGHGTRLMYPGDPSAGAEEVANCRCVVVTRVRFTPRRKVA